MAVIRVRAIDNLYFKLFLVFDKSRTDPSKTLLYVQKFYI